MPSLFTELRRRNVFKVGAAYAIVAWLLVQVVDVVLPALQMPEWTISFVTVLLIIGFPITLIMAWAFEMTPEGIKADADVPSDSITPATGQRLNYVILGLVVLAVGFLVTDQYVLAPRVSGIAVSGCTVTPAVGMDVSTVRRFVTVLDVSETVGDTGLSAHVALSPDGRGIVYAGQVGGMSQLYYRKLDEFDVRPMAGTDGATNPFFSPDGEWVGFYSDQTDQQLKKVSVRGGLSQTLTAAPFASGGFWAADETIYYATQGLSGGRSLFQISVAGGVPELMLSSDNEKGYITPHVLPGSKAALIVVRPGAGGTGNARDGSIAAITFETGDVRTLIEGAFGPKYVPTGHIVFLREGSIWAVPFDAQRLETTGSEVPIIDGVQHDSFRGMVAYALSNTGVLAYVLGGDSAVSEGNNRNLVWVDREGREEQLAVEPRQYSNPRFSPNGQRLAITVQEGANQDVWVFDLLRGTSNPLTFDPGQESNPVWTPDGESVVYYSSAQGLLQRAADGTGRAVPLIEGPPASLIPESFTPDGTKLIYRQYQGMYVLPIGEEPASEPLVESAAVATFSQISPDGNFIAYSSFESGRSQVYVQSFPNLDEGKWQISIDGGIEVTWAPDGNELFFLAGQQVTGIGANEVVVMVARVETDPAFRMLGRPEALFQGNYFWDYNQTPHYDVSPEGQRFLMIKQAEDSSETQGLTRLHVVENWFEELRRLAPPSP